MKRLTMKRFLIVLLYLTVLPLLTYGQSRNDQAAVISESLKSVRKTPVFFVPSTSFLMQSTKLPQGQFAQLVFVDNQDGTFSMTVKPSSNGTYPSNPANLVPGNGITVAGTTPGGFTINRVMRSNAAGTLAVSAIGVSATGVLAFPSDLRQTFVPGATQSGLNVGSVAADPSAPSNGDIWYDSTANLFDFRQNGTTINIPIISGTQNSLTKFATASTLGNSLLTDNGTSITIPAAVGATPGTVTVTGGKSQDAAGGNAGGAISVTAGAGSATGSGTVGGAVTIQGGAADGNASVARAGGAVGVTGGTGIGTGAGGAVNFTGGTSGAAAGAAGGAATVIGGSAAAIAGTSGGTGNLRGGAGSSTGTGGGGGNVVVQGGNAGGSGNNAGGAVTVTGGTGTASSSGGAITLTGGTGGTGAVGAAVNINGGTAGGSGANGGAVTVTGGTPNTSGTGGTVTVQGGAAAATAGSTGGAVAVTGRAGSGTGSGGPGGAVTITGGAAGGDATVLRAGGNISLTAGASLGNGQAGGAISLTAGAAGTANSAGGDITVTPGAGAGSGRPGQFILNGFSEKFSAATAPVNAADATFLWSQDAAAGDNNLYAINEAGKNERLTGLMSRITAQVDSTNETPANLTGLTFNLEAAKFYSFEAAIPTTSDVGGGVKVEISGTATATAITYEVFITNGGLTTQGRGAALDAATGVTAVTAAFVTIKGTIQVANAGTLTVQGSRNAAVGTTSFLVGGYFRLMPQGN